MPTKLGLIHPNMLTDLKTFYPSLCTLRTPTETVSETGSTTYGYVDTANMVNLPCRLAATSGSETRTQEQILTVGVYVVDIPLYLAGILTTHQIVVDGKTYGIEEVAYDGENPHHSTKLTLKVVA